MATSIEYIEEVCALLTPCGAVRYKKMFGEYLAYVNDKPVLLVCDNTTYVKMLPELESLLSTAAIGVPYAGSKPHYILDINNHDLVLQTVILLERITPLPKRKK